MCGIAGIVFFEPDIDPMPDPRCHDESVLEA